MEVTYRDGETKTLINELIQGRELTKQLQTHITSGSSMESNIFLVQRIIQHFNSSLTLLNLSSTGASHSTILVNGTESLSWMSGSPKSTNSDDEIKTSERQETYKKRKTAPKRSEQVQVSLVSGLEGPADDGYSWRKYGQKEILGAKYPRAYYRCTYRHIHGCQATKQVQRSEDNPTFFDIIYKGNHTCRLSAYENTEKQKNSNTILQQQQLLQSIDAEENQNQNFLLGAKEIPKVETEHLEIQFQKSSSFSFPSPQSFIPTTIDTNYGAELSSPFLSPTTSDSTHFTELISCSNSVTNSPLLTSDFTLDYFHLDSDFQFDPNFLS